MNKIWFKRKHYGWGWYPSTWEGWLSLSIWLAVHVYLVATVEAHITLNVCLIILALAALIFICYKKGEKPRWQWGGK